MKVEVSEQVADFVRRQSPEARRRLRLALRKLAEERGDIRALEGPLKGYHRLRAGPYRVVFAYAAGRSAPAIRCIFAERRGVVYEVLAETLREHLLKPAGTSEPVL